jgi:pyridoxine/pyridoxamine 5'-phosphate oxidase
MKIAFVIVTLTLGLSAGDVDISHDNLEPEAVVRVEVLTELIQYWMNEAQRLSKRIEHHQVTQFETKRLPLYTLGYLVV